MAEGTMSLLNEAGRSKLHVRETAGGSFVVCNLKDYELPGGRKVKAPYKVFFKSKSRHEAYDFKAYLEGSLRDRQMPFFGYIPLEGTA